MPPLTPDRDCPDPCAGPCGGCPDRIVCRCLRVTEGEVLGAIAAGARGLREVRRATAAGTGCNGCHRELTELLVRHAGQSPSASAGVICSAR